MGANGQRMSICAPDGDGLWEKRQSFYRRDSVPIARAGGDIFRLMRYTRSRTYLMLAIRGAGGKAAAVGVV